MDVQLRHSGIDVVGAVPWGTHLCHFYETDQDLLAASLPFLRAGLEGGEFCMWLVSDPLSVEGAWTALGRAVPDLDRHRAQHSIEIVSSADWYGSGLPTDFSPLLGRWLERLEGALSRGYPGMRAAGQPPRLGRDNWGAFCRYEKAVNDALVKLPFTALCTYPLADCLPADVLDVVCTHQIATSRRGGSWGLGPAAKQPAVGGSRVTLVSERSPEVVSMAGILESLTTGVHVYDAQWRVTYINPVARRLAQSHGTEPDWILGKHLWEEVFPEVRDNENSRKVQQAMADRVPVSFQNYHAVWHKWFECHVFPLPDGGLGNVFTDVTERMLAEENLRAAEARFRSLSDCAPIMIWVTNAEGRSIFVNRTCLEFVGLTAEQAGSFDWMEALHPADRQACVEASLRALREHLPFHERMRARRHDGSWRWLEARLNPQLDASGRLHAYIGCAADITDIIESKAALEEVGARKDRFLAVLAHELRNPLASIMSGARLLRTTSGAASEQTRGMIEREVAHLTRLVDDLLDIARINAGRIVLRRETVDLRAIVGRAVEMTRPLLDEGRHRLAITIPGEPLLADADAARLVQVLTNLLGNAAKYTPNAGEIRVSGSRVGDQIQLVVADTGIGIAPEELPRIFDTFDSVGPRAHRGLGIGLALTRQLVELHGGSVEALSAGADLGSEFVVRLPAALSPPRLDSPPPVNTAARRPPPPRRILLIDDNVAFAAAMTGLLDSMGHQVQTIHDGSTALETARKFEPHVVLLDIGLPGIAGYEVARRMRQDPTLAKVKLIAMTGYGRDQDKRNAQAAGFDHHLTKPVDDETLASLIDDG